MRDKQIFAGLLVVVFVALLAAGYSLDVIVTFMRPLLAILGF